MIDILENVPLSPLTTFGIGGSAQNFAEVHTDAELREALIWARDRAMPYIILSGGSNVLIPDAGLRGLVIRIASNSFDFDGMNLSVDAGCSLLHLILEAGKRGLGGWESLAGIPGSIGGAVRGNAGAFGSEIRDFTVAARAYNAASGELKTFTNDACNFSYRNSFFKHHPEWVIMRVEMALLAIEARNSLRAAKETIKERERRHLQNVAAAGSYFMNPAAPLAMQRMFENEKGAVAREGRVPAGWLIEKAGMKSATVGGAIASKQHPNYIVNQGSATAHDVIELAEKIKDAVRSQFGVELKEEAAVLK